MKTKNGIYMFINSDLFVIEDDTITYPDYLWFWVEKDFENL